MHACVPLFVIMQESPAKRALEKKAALAYDITVF